MKYIILVMSLIFTGSAIALTFSFDTATPSGAATKSYHFGADATPATTPRDTLNAVVANVPLPDIDDSEWQRWSAESPGNDPIPVSAPSSLALFALGLLGFGLSRGKQR